MGRLRDRIASAVLAFLLLLAGTGCGGGERSSSGAVTTAAAKTDEELTPPRVEQLRSLVTVSMTGARALDWEGVQRVHLTRAGGPTRDVNLLTAGFAEPQILPRDPRIRFRWAFDLLNQYADEPATFTIDPIPAAPSPPAGAEPAAAPVASNVYLTYMQVAEGSKEKEAVFDWDEVEVYEEYNRLAQPCTVQVADEARSGTLRCPALRAENGQIVSLTVSWRPA